MSELALARRMRLLEVLAEGGGGHDLLHFARLLDADERTIRRDVSRLQELLATVGGISVRRGLLHAAGSAFSPGYFSDHLRERADSKRGIARRVVQSLRDNMAMALTAGTTTFYVAREIRRAQVEEQRPRGLIAFTNSLPALHELIAGGISTGVLGEVYNAEDSAFHSQEFQSAFHPEVAIVGASGIVAAEDALILYLHRAEEAAFMKQLLRSAPEVVVAADASKIGRRHPWAFTDAELLRGKQVRLVTDALSADQRAVLSALQSNARFQLEFEEAPGRQSASPPA